MPSMGVWGKTHVRRYKCADWASSKKRWHLDEATFQISIWMFQLEILIRPSVQLELSNLCQIRRPIQNNHRLQNTRRSSAQSFTRMDERWSRVRIPLVNLFILTFAKLHLCSEGGDRVSIKSLLITSWSWVVQERKWSHGIGTLFALFDVYIL